MRSFRGLDWQPRPPLIPDSKVRELHDIFPDEYKRSYDHYMGSLQHFVLGGFMSLGWVHKNVYAAIHASKTRGPYGFFEIPIENDITRETVAQRVFDLTEMLFNLQTVPGFYDFFAKFRKIPPDEFEAAYAELQIAKMLFATGHRFRFVKASDQPNRENYDFEIMFPDGVTAAIEAKARMEQEAVSLDAVANKLSKARRQLPKEAPGMILFKVPQHWFVDRTIGSELRRVALDFLRRTRTVVSVKFYVSVVDLDPVNQMTVQRHAYDEIVNVNTKFEARNWMIFKGNPHRPDWKWLQSYVPLELIANTPMAKAGLGL